MGSVAGQKGNAASFSSSPSGVLTANDNAAISTGDVDFTLIANFYLTNTDGVTILANKGQNGNPNVQDYALIYSASTLIFRVGNGSTNAVVTSAAFTPNAWHTVFAWHDSVSNTINIQIDNGAVNTANYSSGAMDSTYPLSIGAHANKTYVFKGRVDEVSLYKRVFSAYERSWLYNAGSGRAYSELGGTPATTDTVTYTYNPNHKHAVSSLSNGNTYTYDANGNMTARHVLEGSAYQDYTLSYDAENRLVQVQKNGAAIAQFTYDGDGKRVMSEMGAETILFFGAHYEVKNGNQITQYYMAGATRIAMRTYTIPYNNMTLTYLMGDHLGSTSLAVNASTGAVIETRYKAWGEVRYTTPNLTLPTRNTYTGQYSYVSDDATDLGSSGFGLMFYNARWYDPYITHFTQADTIIPESTQGTQAWDRYAGMNNNPIRYNDPTGHWGIPFGFSTSSFLPTLSMGINPADAAGFYDNMATLFNLAAEVLDSTAVAISVGISTSGTAVGDPIGTLVGVPAGELCALPLVIAGNIVASGASAGSIASDILTGETSVDVSGEITDSSFGIQAQGTIGPDTQVSLASFGLGWSVPTSYASLVIQTGALVYDIDSQLSKFGLPNIGLSGFVDPIEFDIDEEYDY